MSFATWRGNALPAYFGRRERWSDNLRDSNVNMTLRIENVPKTVVVVRFDDGHRREIFESGKGSNSDIAATT